MSAPRFAAWLMISQALLFAAETAAIHRIGGVLPLMQLGLIRAVAGMVLAILIGWHLGASVLRTRQLRLQLLRGGIGFLNLWVLLYSFAHLHFADATAIAYTQSAYIALFSALILRERVSTAQWVAAAIGVGGALLIAKPAFSGWDAAYLFAVLGTSLNGLGFVLNRYMQREDSELTTLFYTNLVPTIACFPAVAGMSMPTLGTLALLPAVIVLGPLGMYCGIVAVKYAAAAMLGPYTLLRLVMGLVGGVILFGELPDIWSACGAMAILVSCLLSSELSSGWRGKRRQEVAAA